MRWVDVLLQHMIGVVVAYIVLHNICIISKDNSD